MTNFMEQFMEYLKTATPEQLERDRQVLLPYSNVGPKVEDLLSYALEIGFPIENEVTINKNITMPKNPEYYSGFFILNHIAYEFTCF